MDDGNSSDEEAAGGREADAAEQRLHDRHLYVYRPSVL